MQKVVQQCNWSHSRSITRRKIAVAHEYTSRFQNVTSIPTQRSSFNITCTNCSKLVSTLIVDLNFIYLSHRRCPMTETKDSFTKKWSVHDQYLHKTGPTDCHKLETRKRMPTSSHARNYWDFPCLAMCTIRSTTRLLHPRKAEPQSVRKEKKHKNPHSTETRRFSNLQAPPLRSLTWIQKFDNNFWSELAKGSDNRTCNPTCCRTKPQVSQRCRWGQFQPWCTWKSTADQTC